MRYLAGQRDARSSAWIIPATSWNFQYSLPRGVGFQWSRHATLIGGLCPARCKTLQIMSVVMKSSCYLLSLSVKQRNSGELVLIKQVKPATGLNSCCIIFFTTSVDAFTTTQSETGRVTMPHFSCLRVNHRMWIYDIHTGPTGREVQAMHRLQILTDGYIAEGLTPADARTRARQELRANRRTDWRGGWVAELVANCPVSHAACRLDLHREPAR